jgi:hypothetical protein
MPSPDQSLLAAALIGYGHQLAQLDERISAIRQALGTKKQHARPALMTAAAQRAPTAAATPTTQPKPARRKMSAAGRARIAKAAKKRWRDAKRRGINPITGQPLHKKP